MDKQDWIYAGVLTLLAYMNEWNATLLMVYVAIMVIDTALGAGHAVLDNRFKSSLMRDGLIKKTCNTLLMLALLFGEIALIEAFGIDIPLGTYIISVFVVYELSSVGESAPEPIRKLFKNVIERLQKN